jgi:SAM-dependent methyltransferase
VREHLDLGTGTGRILELFDERAERGLGIDLSHEMVAVARAKLARSPQARRLSVRHGDIPQLPLKDVLFDLVTLFKSSTMWQTRKAWSLKRAGCWNRVGPCWLSILPLTILSSCERNTLIAGWASRIRKWPTGCASPDWKPTRLFIYRAIPDGNDAGGEAKAA